MLDIETSPPGGNGSTSDGWWATVRSERAALVVFVVYVVVALPVILWLGSYHWFLGDEWAFVADRRLTSLSDLFDHHNTHWSTVPVITYRTLFRIFGLHTYVPYQLLPITLHLTTAVLLRVAMRRSGVGPWIATVTASTFVLLGAGHQNIIWAFQVGFVGSVVFGLTQLLLANHDGPMDRRDWFGLGAGLLALMCSGVGVSMTCAVGLATLMRRGWRAAAFHVLPLAGAYLAWYLAIRPPTDPSPPGIDTSSMPQDVVAFGLSGIAGAFERLGGVSFMGYALGALFVVGLVLAWAPLDWATFRRRASIPVGLLGGLTLFWVATSSNRWWFGFEQAKSSRYIHITVALLLPALGVAAYAIVSRWRVAAPVVVVVLLIGVPTNISDFDGDFPFTEPFHQQERRLMPLFAQADELDQVDDWVTPDRGLKPWVTARFLRHGRDAGWFPEPDGPPTAEEAAIIRTRLLLAQTDRVADDDADCETYDEATLFHLTEGDEVAIISEVLLVQLQEDGELLPPVSYNRSLSDGEIFVPQTDLDVVVWTNVAGDPFQFCP